MPRPAPCESPAESTPDFPFPRPSGLESDDFFNPEDIQRRRQARRQANRLANRLTATLGIHWLLTPAPARAFFELVRKFAKDHQAGREPLYDRPRSCLAEDAGVSCSAFDQMRRIAVERGWIVAEVARAQLENGQWTQEPTIYRPGPLARQAMNTLLSSNGNRLVKNYEHRGSNRNIPSPSPRSETASGLQSGNGWGAEPPSEPPPLGEEGDAASAASTSKTTEKKDRAGAGFTFPRVTAPPQIGDIAALRTVIREALEASGQVLDAGASDTELIEGCDALRRRHCPEIPDADWTRAVRHRGLWAATALLAVLSKTKRGRARQPGRAFSWWAWHGAKRLDNPVSGAAAAIAGLADPDFTATRPPDPEPPPGWRRTVLRHIGPENYRSWIEDLPEPVIKDDVAAFVVRSRFLADWLRSNHSQLIRSALGVREVVFRVEENR